MTSTDLRGLTFLFSSFQPPPRRFFQGFAFVDEHYIAGQEGALAFEAQIGAPMRPGEDGCYVVATETESGYRIGVDHVGLQKMFYYDNGDVWCVSNSVAMIAEHLTAHGVRVSANLPQLTSHKMPHTFAMQLSSTRTAFNEIRLAPLHCAVEIVDGHLRLVRIPRLPAAPDYTEGLRRFVSTWARRVQTMLSSERVWFDVDLSGGVDSRTVFAFVRAAQNQNPSDDIMRRINLRSSRSEHLAEDLAAASTVAEAFEMPINGPQPDRPKPPALTGWERYEAWRRIHLGVYMPVYFPVHAPNPWHIHFHGGGGETHRRFYAADDPATMLARQKDYHRPKYLFEAWKQEVLGCVAELQPHEPHLNPMVLHYREFRNRFHVGLNSQYRVVCSPLNSRLLEVVTRSNSNIDSKQILYDVMESLVPGLNRMPYDVASKSPSVDELTAMTVVDGALDGPGKGRVFASEETSAVARHSTAKPISLMAEAFEAADRPLVVEFMGEARMSTARGVMQDAVSRGRFTRAADANDISLALAVAHTFQLSHLG
ncbi:hypothetical protein [Desertihabitans aurantiacus]|uniref:hypothetical protein n=1 Tax=Desertihabitans aurantiacus TaxID=2282477 RepID=UPI000DF82674|nr:hypothetical protein [Desertihabitans aurantiacus]